MRSCRPADWRFYKTIRPYRHWRVYTMLVFLPHRSSFVDGSYLGHACSSPSTLHIASFVRNNYGIAPLYRQEAQMVGPDFHYHFEWHCYYEMSSFFVESSIALYINLTIAYIVCLCIVFTRS